MPFSRQLRVIAFLPLAFCLTQACGHDASAPTEPNDAAADDTSRPTRDSAAGDADGGPTIDRGASPDTSVDATAQDRDASIEPTDEGPSTRDSKAEIDVSLDASLDEDTGDIGKAEIDDTSNESRSLDVQDVGLSDAPQQFCTDDPYDGKACSRGGVACLQNHGPCWVNQDLFCCYAQCVCSSSSGIWDCSVPGCESVDAAYPCEAGLGSGSLEGSALADLGDWVYRLAIGGPHVYWYSFGTIGRVSMLDGGAMEKLVQPGTQDPKPEGFALDDQSLYWYAQSQIFALPLAGGTPRQVATSSNGIMSLFTDSTSPDLYVGQPNAIAAVPKSGGALRTLYQTPSSRSFGGVSALAAGSLYLLESETHLVSTPPGVDASSPWPNWSSLLMNRVPVTGGPAEPVLWMRGVAALATNGVDTYWSNQSSADVWQLRHVSAAAASIMLTAAQRASINWIAFDDQHLYYLQRQQGCRSPIMRVPKSGGTPETVVYDATPATSVLLGNGKLFWTSGPSSTVLRSLDL